MEVLCEVLLFYNENGGLFCFEYLFTILGSLSHIHKPAGCLSHGSGGCLPRFNGSVGNGSVGQEETTEKVTFFRR